MIGQNKTQEASQTHIIEKDGIYYETDKRTFLKHCIDEQYNIYYEEMQKGTQSNQQVMSSALSKAFEIEKELDQILGWS